MAFSLTYKETRIYHKGQSGNFSNDVPLLIFQAHQVNPVQKQDDGDDDGDGQSFQRCSSSSSSSSNSMNDRVNNNSSKSYGILVFGLPRRLDGEISKAVDAVEQETLTPILRVVGTIAAEGVNLWGFRLLCAHLTHILFITIV